MLNGLWLGFFVVAALAATLRWIGGDVTVWAAMVESLFAMAKVSVELMVVLFGTLTLWTDRKFNRMRPSMARVLGLETRSAKEG